MIKRIAKATLRTKTRIAGGLFLLLVATSACTEFFARGRLGSVAHLAAGSIEVCCMVAVTLLLYDIFSPAQKQLSLAAMCLNLMAVTLLLLGFQVGGVNVGIGLHGAYWLLIACLMYRSNFFPRMLSVLPAISSLCWLAFLLQPNAGHLSRYFLGVALIAEGSTMLWFLAIGANRGNNIQAASSGAERS